MCLRVNIKVSRFSHTLYSSVYSGINLKISRRMRRCVLSRWKLTIEMLDFNIAHFNSMYDTYKMQYKIEGRRSYFNFSVGVDSVLTT